MKEWKRSLLCVASVTLLGGCAQEPAYSSVTKEQYEAAFTPADNFTQAIETTVTSDSTATLTMKETYRVTEKAASWEEIWSGSNNGTIKAYWWFDDKGALNYYEKDTTDGDSSYVKFLKYPSAEETTVASLTDFGYKAQRDTYTYKRDCSIFALSYAGMLNYGKDELSYDKVQYDEKERAYVKSMGASSYKLSFASGVLSKLLFTNITGSSILYHQNSTFEISAYGTTEAPVVPEEAKNAEPNKNVYVLGETGNLNGGQSV